MQNLIFSVNTVAPVFLIVFIGVVLKRFGIIDNRFNAVTSRMVFTVAMPALLFEKLATTQFSQLFDGKQMLFLIVGLTVMAAISWIVGMFVSYDGRDRGAFIQGSFRSNFAIVGFALIFNAFGESALAKAALILAVIMPLYNVLSIIALTVPMNKERNIHPIRTLLDILKNPLIIAAMISIPISILQIPIHFIVSQTIEYLAGMTLPLALISIGATLSFTSIKEDVKLATGATLLKTVVMPLFLTFAAYAAGFRGTNLGIMYILFATPTAIASFIMAEAMGSNGKLAGNIVLLSTCASVITLSIGIFILRTLGLF